MSVSLPVVTCQTTRFRNPDSVKTDIHLSENLKSCKCKNAYQITNLNISASIFRCSGLPMNIAGATKVINHSKFNNKQPYVRQFLVERLARVGDIPE
jgi:hypothetical protein